MSHKRNKKAAASTGVTLARLVDLSNFIVAFDTYNQILVLRGIDNDPMFSKGRVLAKRFLAALQEGVVAHLTPIIMERPDAAVFRPVLRQAQRPGTPEMVAPKISALLANFFPWLRARQAVFATLFSGRTAKAAREVAMVVQEESLESRLNKAAMIAPVSGLMIPRKWIEQAASAVGVPLSPVESLRTDAQVAQDLSTQLQQVESKLQGANPQTPEAADLEGERLGIMENMERLADQSVSPEVIKAIAVAPSPHPEHATAMGKKLGMTPEQEEAMMLTGKGIIAAGAGAGKCVKYDTLVPTEIGFLTLGEIASTAELETEEDTPCVLTLSGPRGPVKSSHIYRDGIRQTIRIETSQGFSIEGTAPHRIFVLRDGVVDWVRLDDIHEGDWACIDRRNGLFSEKPFKRVARDPKLLAQQVRYRNSALPLELTPQVATLLGFIISEGHIRPDTWGIQLCTNDPAQMALYKEAAEGLGGTEWSDKRNDVMSLNIHRRVDIEALFDFGLTRGNAQDKEIPNGILRSPKPVVKAFLRALFDGDGGVTKRGLEYCTVSNRLADQLQVVLLSFGIISRKKFRPNLGRGAWHLYISSTNARQFRDEIGFGLETKQKALDAVCAPKINPNLDVIPGVSALYQEIKDAYQRLHGTLKTMEDGYGTFKCLINGSRNATTQTALRFLGFYPVDCPATDKLKELATSGWFFDQVVDIENLEADTYDFVVPEVEAFSAGGFINHNTRVLAGKVVDTIERLGARSSQIIATSFSSKSAAELTSRVKSYGGESILDAGSDGFGTTHSIGKRMLHEFDPAVPKGTRIQEPAYIIKMAMEQVKLDPSTFDVPQMPTPMGMFEGFLGTTTSVAPPVTKELVTPSPEAFAEMDPATLQFQKLLGELQGLAQWGEGKGYTWASGDLRVLNPILQAGKGPGDLTGPERAALNKLLSTNRAQKKLKSLSMSSSFKVARARLAATSVYWKQPANQWFNIGLSKFEDAAGRAIGPRRCETAISQFRADLITPEQAWSKEQSQFAAVYGAYTWIKNNDPMNSGAIDFDDMLQKAVAVLVRDPRALATMQARFKYILVDEAQDLNRMQHLLFGLIAGTIDPAAVSGAKEIPSVQDVSYKDGRMAAKTFVFIGDDKQCVSIHSRIPTPESTKTAGDLKEGDAIFSYRNGKIVPQQVRHVVASRWNWGYQVTTESGNTVTMSPNHKLWATSPQTDEGQIVVYLMYRDDMGFRVGITNKGKVGSEGDYHASFGGRCFLEKADKLWVLDVCENREEALLKEYQTSLKYSVPTMVFNGEHRGISQERIDTIFKEFGHNGMRILEERHLSFGLPHWMSQSYTKHGRERHTINLIAHSGSNTQVAMEWSGDKFDEVLEGEGVKKAPQDRRRLRRWFANYRLGLAFAERVSEATGAQISHKLSTPEGALREIPASGLFVGMSVPILDGDAIALDPILSIKETKGQFVDLDVNDASNFFPGGILTSNSIYEFRGARPDEFIEKSDLVEGDFTTVLLSTNFRSGEAIVDAANKLIAHNEKQIPMTCDSNPEKGKGSIHNVVVADHQAGAELAADEIQQATSGEGATASYSDFGVAVRTNAEAYAFGVEMIRRGIPFRSKVNFFNDSTTKAILYWLKLAGADLADKNAINECVLSAHKAPNFGLDKVFESALQQRARGQNYLEYLRNGGWEGIYNQEWRNSKNVKGYTDTLVQVFNMTGSPEELLGQILDLKGTMFKGVQQTIVDALVAKVKGSPDAMDLLFEEVGGSGDVSDEAIRNMALAPIQPLMSLIGGYEDIGPALDYVSKLQRANEKKGKKDDPKAADYNEPAVVIDTCHGWKGLEVPNLYVPMARGVFPHKRSEEEGADAMASERRLAYVALTRGEQSVTVINPMITHTGQPGGVSPFVTEACIKPPGHEDPSTDAAPARTTPERTAFLLSYAKGDFDDEAEDTLAAWEMGE